MRCFLLTLFTLFFALTVHAQPTIRDTAISVAFYGVEDGLAQSDVTSIFRDSYGLIWFGTESGGLTVYDAEKMRSFFHNTKDSTSLGSNWICNISEDTSGNLWIATKTGISRFNRENLTFKNYSLRPPNAHGRPYLGARNAFCSPDGHIWVLNTAELLQYDPSTDTFLHYPLPEDMNTHYKPPALQMRSDRNGRLWLLAQGVLRTFDPESKTFFTLEEQNYKSKHLEAADIVSFDLSPGDTLTIGLHDRILLFPSPFSLPTEYPIPQRHNAEQPSGLQKIELTEHCGLWCVIEGQLAHLNTVANEWLFITTQYAKGIEVGKISGTGFDLRDPQVFWYPVLNGVARWPREPSIFQHLTHSIDGKLLLANPHTSAIYVEDDDIWAGSWYGGITRINKKKKTSKIYSSHAPYKNSARDSINSIHRLSSGELLAATSSGLIHYDKATDRWIDFTFAGNTASLSGWTIRDFLELRDGSLCLATGWGVFFYNHIHNVFKSVPSLKNKDILGLEYDGHETIWLSTWDGLHSIDLRDTSVRKHEIGFSHPTTTEETSSNISLVSTCLGNDGTLWVGTTHGLYKRDRLSQEFISVIPDNFFHTHAIYAVEIDELGRVWFGISNGLAEYDPHNSSYQVYGATDGLKNLEFNLNASYKADDGILYFGGIQGITSINPVGRDNTRQVYPVIISSCLFHGYGLHREIFPHEHQEIRLTREYPAITISLSKLNYLHPGHAKYQFMLEGFNETWEDILSHNTITLRDLPEGRYVLRYRGSNYEGVWMEGTPYTLIVEKPFLQTRLARALLVLALLLGLGVFIGFFIFRTKRMHLALDEREAAMSEMNEQKHLLQVQYESITNSITYSRRIQETILPSEAHMAEICPDSFVLYLPRDIVSGDFYWLSRTGQYIYLSVIDCTGHGVPGALMSIIGHVHLRSIIHDQEVASAAKILSLLNERLIESQKMESGPVLFSDAMDLTMCVIDTKSRMIDFSGAFQHLFHVNAEGLHVYRGDRVFTGSTPDAKYTSRMVRYSPEDMLYLFSDGFLDQIGGVNDEKFLLARFQQLIESVSQFPMAQQRDHLLDTLHSWQGNNEQIDDITVFGVRCNFPE